MPYLTWNHGHQNTFFYAQPMSKLWVHVLAVRLMKIQDLPRKLIIHSCARSMYDIREQRALGK